MIPPGTSYAAVEIVPVRAAVVASAARGPESKQRVLAITNGGKARAVGSLRQP